MKQKKNVVIVSQFAGNNELGMVYRNSVWAEELVRQGCNVTVIAASFSHVRDRQPITRGPITRSHLNGVNYLWLWVPKYKASSLLGRVFAMLVFSVSLLWGLCLAQRKVDIVVASCPSPLQIFPSWLFSRIKKAKLVFDVRDMWPLTLVMLGGISSSHPFVRLLQFAENFACRKADVVTAVQQNIMPYLARHGFESADADFLHIPNAVDLGGDGSLSREYHLAPELQDSIKTLKENCEVLIGYTGSIGTANAMWVLIEALAQCNASVALLIVGKGPEKKNLLKLVEDFALQNRVLSLDPVDRVLVPVILSHVDYGYVGGHKTDLYDWGASPTKVCDYFKAKLPVIYTVGDPSNAVEKSRAGFSCGAEDVDRLTTILNGLSKIDVEQRKKNGRVWISRA